MGDLIGEAEALASALDEQKNNGELSAKTTLSLMEAGYAAALAIDEETGAVTLSADSYRELYNAKILEQQATLVAERSNIVRQLEYEKNGALNAAGAYSAMAIAKRAAMEEEAKALDLQIGLLDQMLKNPIKVGGGGSARSSGSGGAKKKTSEGIAVEAFKVARAEMDYLRDMDIKAEDEYYADLLALQTKHLKEGSDEWKKVNIEIYRHKKDVKAELEKNLQEEQAKGYKQFMADLDFERALDLVSEREYFDRLEQYINEHLDKSSDEYRAGFEKIYSYRKSQSEKMIQEVGEALSKELDLIKSALQQQQEAYREWADGQIASIERLQKAEEDRLTAVIEGIDLEIQKRRELREDEDYDAKIARARKDLQAAQAQLTFARDAQQEAEFRKEVIRKQQALEEALRTKEDAMWYRAKEEEKQAVRDQIEAAREQAERDKARVNAELASRITQAELAASQKENAKTIEAENRQMFLNSQANVEQMAAQAAEKLQMGAVQNITDNSQTTNKVTINMTQAAALTSGQVMLGVTKALEKAGSGVG